jgi:hypothetical protein
LHHVILTTGLKRGHFILVEEISQSKLGVEYATVLSFFNSHVVHEFLVLVFTL